MNRAARRKTDRRGPAPQLAGFRFFLTVDEAKVVEEALHGYRQSLREDWGEDMPKQSAWAYERAERLRQALLAAIENRPHVDPAPQRTAPDLSA